MIYHGDLFDVLPTLEADSIDACVTDPPYAFPGGFMGKPWDSFDGREDAGFYYWLSGLIDGEGCFTVKAHTRGTHAPSFTLKMRSDEEGTLEIIRRTLGIGSITREERDPNPCSKWTVQDKAGCQRLVDVLDKYPLRAKKRMDYAIWREAVCEWSERPRGNRWHGAADNSKMAGLRKRLMAGRAYESLAWSGHEYQDWTRLWAREVMRVLKPGAHLLAFGSTRGYHRMTCGLEEAGFEVRDSLLWLQGAGFPKSLNLGDGRGTALKPAHEQIVLARKPLIGTVAENVLTHGTGAINIDACRIKAEAGWQEWVEKTTRPNSRAQEHIGAVMNRPTNPTVNVSTLGRWPANVLLDDIAAAQLDEEVGQLDGHGAGTSRQSFWSDGLGEANLAIHKGEPGGPSRFFYIAKPSREERDAGIYERHWLNTGEIVYNEAAWVDAALSQRLQVDTGTLRERATEGSTTRCNGGSEWSMCWCGSLSTDPYHPAITSIIATDRSSITGQRISNSSRRPHTNGCMAAAFGVMAAGGNLADYAEFQSPWAERIGTSHQKAGRSTDDADLATSVRLWLTSKPDNGGGQRVRARNSHPT